MNTKPNFVCPVCQSKSFSKIFTLNSYDYISCDGCKVITTNPFPTTKMIEEFYLDKAKSGAYQGLPEQNSQRLTAITDYFNSIMNHHGFDFRDKEVLDAGCFNGIGMLALKSLGANPYGVEYQESAAIETEKMFPGRVWQQNLCEPFDLKIKFDFIFLSDVIEHLPNPTVAIRQLINHLKCNGTLIVSTPNTSSPVAKIMGVNWPSFEPVHHVYLFNKNNLSKLLNDNGLSITGTHSIWKRYSMGYVTNILESSKPNLANKVRWLTKLHMFCNLKIPLNGGEIAIVAQKK